MLTKCYMILCGALLALLLLLTLGVGRATAQDAVGSFIPSTCMFEAAIAGVTGEALGFECGYVVVPVRHAEPDGPTMRLPVAVRRAPGGEGAPDPLLLAQGGPGGDAFEIFTFLLPTTTIANDRDVVVFNQRGTPYALPELACAEIDAAQIESLPATPEESERLFLEALDACYRRLAAEGVDLSAFNSLENAADVPMIARALGYDEYNFYGVSYGTLLGLHLMRNHPDGLRSVILDSVVAPDTNFIGDVAASEDRVLDEVFAACDADSYCRIQYPNLEERYFALVHRFDENPVALTLVDPESGERHETFLDGRGFRDALHSFLYQPRMYAALPKVIYDLERSDTSYIEAMWPLLLFDQNIAYGMYYSVICAEDADIDLDAIPLGQLRPEIAATARDDLQQYIDACDRWPVEVLPASVDEPVSSNIPTLLLAGQFDPVTPPAFAEAAATGLTNATVLVDPLASHGVAFINPCLNGIVADFLNDPTQPPSGACLDGQMPARYVPPNAVTLPLIAEVNSLRPSLLASLGVAGLLLLIVLSPFIVWPAVYVARAFANRKTERTAEERRLRLVSRGLLLLFGALAFLFAMGLFIFIVASIANQTLATASALSPAARPLLWLPLALLGLAVGVLGAAFALWSRHSGTVAGRVYFTIVAICAVTLVMMLGARGLLWPPL